MRVKCKPCYHGVEDIEMKYVFCLILSVLLMADVSYARSRKQNEKWRLVFRDEFNQKDGSRPDTTKWVTSKRYATGWPRWVSNSRHVIFIKKGQLVCRALANNGLEADTARALTSAIETSGKFSFQYGKVEVRMKTNNLRGNLSAVWMKPAIDYPKIYGEIDIAETFGNMGVVQQTVHSQQTVVLKKVTAQNAFRTTLPVEKWHIYGVEWSPDKIIYTVDGKVSAVYRKSNDKQDLAEGQWTFDRPFFLILSQSLGEGVYECLTPDLNNIFEMRIDWIRVYQKAE